MKYKFYASLNFNNRRENRLQSRKDLSLKEIVNCAIHLVKSFLLDRQSIKFSNFIKFYVWLNALQFAFYIFYVLHIFLQQLSWFLCTYFPAYLYDIRAGGIGNFIKHHRCTVKNATRVRSTLIQFNVHRHVNQIKHGMQI